MYIWNKEIKTVEWEVITFTDDSKIKLSSENREYLQTEESSDDLHIRKSLKAQLDILKVIADLYLDKTEVSEIMHGVTQNIARYEKDLLCNITGQEEYMAIPIREIMEIHKGLDSKKFIN